MALELKTTDAAGKSVGTVSLDEGAFGERIKPRLLHAAAVMYHNNLRQGSACTKTRAQITGSTKKLYRQKGTGRARAGNGKAGTRVGGGVIHGPQPRNFVYHMPRKQRQAALKNAVLAKAKDGELHVVAGLAFDAPKTKNMLALLAGHGLSDKTVLVATDGLKPNVHKSGRNLQGVSVIPAAELTARQILAHAHVVIEQGAFDRMNQPKQATAKRSRKPKGTRKASNLGEEK
jgi:large subunit ribosomal protein L4